MVNTTLSDSDPDASPADGWAVSTSAQSSPSEAPVVGGVAADGAGAPRPTSM